jgi:hypothetical protein
MPVKFKVSDEFIAWAQSLSGMLTTVQKRFGGAAEMLENPGWEEGKTMYALALVASLREDLRKVHLEMECHVEDKYGKTTR